MAGRTDEPVLAVLRVTRADAWRSTRGPAALVVVVGALYTFGGLQTGDVLGWTWDVATVLVVAADLLSRFRTRVVLTDRHAVLLGGFRAQRLAVADIHGLQRLDGGGIVIWTADRLGHDIRVRLHSADGRDPVDVIGHWWLEHRGVDWQQHWGPASTRWYDAAPGSRRTPKPHAALPA